MSKSDHAIYAGSFDPLTNGHLNIIERGSLLFERLTVAIAHNTSKSALFSHEDKLEMVRECTGHLDNVDVDAFDGLLVNYARSVGARVLLRGLRSVKDFEYEFQMALTNRELSGDMETVFLVTEGKYAHVASSLIREIAAMGGDVQAMVPPAVAAAVRRKFPSA